MKVHNTQLTGSLEEHEKVALKIMEEQLEKVGEQGVMIPSLFKSRDEKLYGHELDCVIVTLNLVLVLELKMRNFGEVHVKGINDELWIVKGGMPGVDDHRAAWNRKRAQEIGEALKAKGLDKLVKFYTGLIIYNYNKSSETLQAYVLYCIEAGSRVKVAEGYRLVPGMGVAKPEAIANLILKIRQEDDSKAGFVKHLAEDGKKQLETITEVVLGKVLNLEVTLEEFKALRQQRIGSYLKSAPAVLQENDRVAIYAGESLDTKELVWLKEYRQDLLGNRQYRKANHLWVVRDATALTNFGDHPNLVRFNTTLNLSQDHFYVILRRTEGNFLHALVENNALDQTQKLKILLDLLAGLAHIHSFKESGKTALYRDLRPESIFVTEQGRAQLFNFDLTRLPNQPTVRDEITKRRNVKDNSLTSWKDYASLEILDGAYDQVGTFSDLFSWAVLAYILLTGQLPYTSAANKAKGKLTEAGFDQLLLPQTLKDQMIKALSQNPDARPTLAELHTSLKEALDAQE